MPLYLKLFFGLMAISISLLALKANADFYSATFATDEHSRLTYIGLAMATCAVKLSFPAGLAYVVGHRVLKAFGWFAVGCAVLFDVFGALGYMHQTRGVKIESHGIEAREYRDKGLEVQRLRERADAYNSSRPTAEVEAEHEAAKRLAATCDDRTAHLDRCKRPGILAAELARARERDKRETDWQTAKTAFENLTLPKGSADPQADAFGSILDRIGLGDGKVFVTLIFSILILVIFEVIPPIAAFLALYSPPDPKKVVRFDIADTCAPPAKPQRPTPKGKAAGGLDIVGGLEALLISGAAGLKIDASARRVEGSQRRIAEALGLSAARINRELEALVSAGKVKKSASPSGTVIILT